jgi:hypothetical protein
MAFNQQEYDRQRYLANREKKLQQVRAAELKRYGDEEWHASKRASMLKWKYGLSSEEYNVMWIAQGGKCYICGQEETVRHPRTDRVASLSVDHDHETGRIRKLLCRRCNRVLGLIEDDPDIALGIAEYIKAV